MRPPLQIGDLGTLLATLASEVARESDQALQRRGLFAVAIAGGSVVDEGGTALATVPLDWPRTHVFWVDERAVPPDHPDSNFREARRRWLEPAGAPERSLHRMPGDAADLEAAADAYRRDLHAVLGPAPQLDCVLLGAGADGHVASLFPGRPSLDSDALVLAIDDSPKPPPRRLTLGLSMLVHANRVIALVLGASKAAMIREVVEQDDSTLPLALVLRRTRAALLLLDPAAASML
jgi:6-phosphogluconolactonase